MSTVTHKPVAQLDQSEALAICKSLGTQALETNNLDLLFGSNGMTGARARGVYTLLSKCTNLSRSFLGRVFKGEGKPSEDTLILLESVTGVDRGLISRYMQEKREMRSVSKKAA